jgi:hypothetical protein
MRRRRPTRSAQGRRRTRRPRTPRSPGNAADATRDAEQAQNAARAAANNATAANAAANAAASTAAAAQRSADSAREHAESAATAAADALQHAIEAQEAAARAEETERRRLNLAIVDGTAAVDPSTPPPGQDTLDYLTPEQRAELQQAQAAAGESLYDFLLREGEGLIDDLTGFADVRACVIEADVMACLWAIISILPLGRFLAVAGKLLRLGVKLTRFFSEAAEAAKRVDDLIELAERLKDACNRVSFAPGKRTLAANRAVVSGCGTTMLYRVVGIERGSAEKVHGLDPKYYVRTATEDGTAFFGDLGRTTDFYYAHSDSYGWGYQVAVSTQWLNANVANGKIEKYENFLNPGTFEYLIPPGLFVDFNEFPRSKWTLPRMAGEDVDY